MKVSVSRKTGEVMLQIEDEVDVANVSRIAEVVNMAGWKILQGYIQVGREAIIEAGKESSRKRVTVELASKKWAMLDGYDNCGAIAETLVANGKEFAERIQNNRKTEEDNGLRGPDESE